MSLTPSPFHPPLIDSQVATELSPATTEFDLLSAPSPRPDPPGPLQLETRGLTSHVCTPRTAAEKKRFQEEFWAAHTQHKFAVAAKLRQAGDIERAERLEWCHSEYSVGQCLDCGKVTRFPVRCDQFFCPECQPKLSRERRESIEWWTKEITQPKHVVLTLVNLPDLEASHVRGLKVCFARLRRTAFCTKLTHFWVHNETGARRKIKHFRLQDATHHTETSYPWLGGFYSIEVTNEGRGWHLHLHCLVDCRFIDSSALAREWEKATRGFGYIVKVKDARDRSYLHELTKYAVKGSDLAKWTPDQIVTFINAFDGQRTFGVFGSLYGKRTEFKEWLDALKNGKPKCECGSDNVKFWTEAAWLIHEHTPDPETKPRPPSKPEHPELKLDDPRFYGPH